jgi:Na+-transporting methylmalonyl-CoA/oxaloacetate decarboxylase gamma subunit
VVDIFERGVKRALAASVGIAKLVGADHEEELKQAIAAALVRHRRPDGSYPSTTGSTI